MTQQYTGRNNITISMPDGGSVPIVSQTEIDPMKIALSLMLALATRTALTEPLPVPKRQGRAARARTPTSRAAHSARRHRVLRTPSQQRHVSVGMDCSGLVLLAKWTRAALAFALASFSLSRVHRRAARAAAASS